MRVVTGLACAAAAGCALGAFEARAANPEFQDFFFAVCGTASGTLAARCSETPSGLGNLSGDSESSLNPTQNLGHNLTPVSVAQARSKAVRERGEKLRDEDEPAVEQGARVDAGPFSLLINVQGTWFEREVDSEAGPERSLDGDSAAAEIGLDYRLSDRTVLGALIGFEQASYDFGAEAPGVNFAPAASAGDGELDNVYATLFASWLVGSSGFVELSGGYELADGRYRRNSVFQESTRTLPQTDVRVSGSADGTTTWLSANGGFDVSRDAWSFGPFVGITWTQSEIDGYTEQDLSGSGLAMGFGKTERDSLLGHVGFRVSYAISTSGSVVLPQLRAEYQHEFEDDPASAMARYTLDPAATEYLFVGGEVDRDSVNAGLSLAMILPGGWMTFADVSMLFGHDTFDRTRATLGLRKEF